MAGQITAASTLVASILEHQGLLTQASILDGFQGFFRDAGALLYMIAGIGAIASLLLYGSFRAPRYLLIGPALFWFLVGPRAEGIDGVVWKLGEGATLGFNGVEDPNAEYRDKVLRKSGFDPDEQPRVAQGFWLFAATINELTNEVVGVLLKQEEDSDLIVASRAYGLEMINSGKIDEGQLLSNAQQGLMLGCQEMMAEAHAAANQLIKVKAGNVNKADLENGLKSRLYQEHIAAMKKAAKKYIDPKFGTLYKPLSAKLRVGTNITCEKVWEIVSEETWHRSARGMARIVRVATQGLQNEELAADVCKNLIRKSIVDKGLSADDAGVADCNFQPAVALALLNNQLTKSHNYNQIFNRHWNEGTFKSPRTYVAAATGVGSAGSSNFEISNGIGHLMIGGLAKFGAAVGLMKAEDVGNGMVKYTMHMAPVTVLQQEYGLNDAMWVSTREFELVKLKQKIFSYAINIPYYQGMLLYIIAVMYPFMALLVLIPGKAIGFLNVPLAWLWVKSWDIGFAAIITLDKVLYNLLPSPNVDQELRQGPWTSLDLLPKVIAEGYNFDPIGSLHHYYSILAFVWLSVPIISGFVTLKAKRGVLSMFPDAAQSIASETASAASEAYSILAQDKRTALLKELQGAAAKLPISGSNSIGQGLPGGMGIVYASIAMMGQTDKVAASKMLSGDAAKSAKLGDAAIKWNETYAKITEAETRLQSSLASSYDPILGRWSDMGMLQGAYTAAMDGGGGYELYNHETSVSGALIDAAVAKEGVILDTLNNATSNFTKSVTGSLVNGARGDYATMVSNMGESNLVLATMMATLSQTKDPDKMRKTFGLEGYSDAELRTAFTNELPKPVYEAGLINGSSATPDTFVEVFAPSQIRPTPGGFSQYLNHSLSALGGDRAVRYEHNPELAAQLTATRSPENPVRSSVTDLFTSPLGTAAAIGTSVMSNAFTPQGPMDSNFVNADPVFRNSIVADNHFQVMGSPFYSEQVHDRTTKLTAFLGPEAVRNFHSLTPSQTISPTHVVDYVEHLYETKAKIPNATERQQQRHFQAYGLDTRYTARADSNPLAALDAAESWLTNRGGYRNTERFAAIPVDAPVVTRSYQLWGDDK